MLNEFKVFPFLVVKFLIELSNTTIMRNSKGRKKVLKKDELGRKVDLLLYETSYLLKQFNQGMIKDPTNDKRIYLLI